MRSLTDAEGRIIAVLLGAAAEPERQRLKRADVPRSTYHAARRRAYEEGWLQDRYVPDPVRLGYPWASFVLLRPYADKIEETSRRWSSNAQHVLGWWSPQVALGVFLHRSEKEVIQFARSIESERPGSGALVLAARLTEAEVPAFFDYEGLWAHLADLPGAISYPSGLGGNFPGGDGPGGDLSDHQRWAISELVRRPFGAEGQARPGHLVGPFGLPFSQQRLLRAGWIAHRVFLYPSRVPPFRGRSADQVVFVSGALRPGARPEGLFATLTRDCRVYPFLYVVHSNRVLLGALGRAPGASEPRQPAGPDPPARQPVMPTLRASLEGIDVIQELATQIRTTVDLRFDRLLPPREK